MAFYSGGVAYQNLINGFKDRSYRYPTKKEPSYRGGLIFPKIIPKFKIFSSEKVFTIGSCFAREIEMRLARKNIVVPVLGFKLPPNEFPHPDAHDAHILNEYNVGTILQRIENCFGKFEYGEDVGIEEARNGYLDLFLHVHSLPVAHSRLVERRKEIKVLYNQMNDCEVVIITLGLVEAWFDTKYNCYLNKAPNRLRVQAEPDRFLFHRMEVQDVLPRLIAVIDLLNQHSLKKIVLTVSPIPLEATFSGQNAIMANSYSKAVLRVVAEHVYQKFENVDYFPSFEIATSAGISHFQEDNVHINDNLGEEITAFMLQKYTGHQDSSVEFDSNIRSSDAQYLERLKIG